MRKISRRNFLVASGAVAITAALSACGGSSSTASSTAASSAVTNWVRSRYLVVSADTINPHDMAWNAIRNVRNGNNSRAVYSCDNVAALSGYF